MNSHKPKTAIDMETPKLYTIGESELPSLVTGTQGELSHQTEESNQRGGNSTDFQFMRERPDQVAAGNNSFIAAGESNQLNGTHSFIAAGYHNEVSGDKSIASGEHNTVKGDHSAAFGLVNEVNGPCSVAGGSCNYIEGESAAALGDGNIVAGYASFAEGGLNVCYAAYSHAGGKSAQTYNETQYARSGGSFNDSGATGEAQYTNIIAKCATEDEVPRDLVIGEDKAVILMRAKVNAFKIMVVASTPDQLEAGSWEIRGIILQKESPSSTLIPGPVSKTVITKTRPDWDVQVTADTEQGALRITARGEENTSIRWVAFIEFTEVGFYA